MPYTITPKGRAVLHSATLWGLSSRLQSPLAFCDPRVSLEGLRQFMRRCRCKTPCPRFRSLS